MFGSEWNFIARCTQRVQKAAEHTTKQLVCSTAKQWQQSFGCWIIWRGLKCRSKTQAPKFNELTNSSNRFAIFSHFNQLYYRVCVCLQVGWLICLFARVGFFILCHSNHTVRECSDSVCYDDANDEYLLKFI